MGPEKVMGEVVEIKVEGMGCQSCVSAVEGAVKRVAPGAEVAVDLAGGLVRIAGTDETRARLEAAIEAAGYDIVKS